MRPHWRERFGQLARFGIVGVVASGIHYGVYCLILLATGATMAFTVGYAVALVCNYFLTTFFTFRAKPSPKNMAGFGFSHLVNYLLQVALLNLFLWLDMGEHLAPIAVLAVAVPVNFTILRFVYRKRRKGRVFPSETDTRR
jgi:putative flippase GtrA